jgi:formylglycine-generating enzyme required for sulfatase activity
LADYREWADPLLREKYAGAGADSQQRLHASLGLLPVDASQVAYLYGRLLDAKPGEVPVIRDALASHKGELLDKLWAAVETPGKDSHRLRAAGALAKYDPESEKWAKAARLVAQDLVLENPVILGQWGEAFRPVKSAFLTPLADIFGDRRAERAAERSLATSLLADYAADRPQRLADLLLDADDKQFAVIYPRFKEQGERGLPILTNEIDKKLPPDLPSSDKKREELAKRQANAAVALLRMNQPEKVWPLLKHSPDPRVRSYLVHRFGPLGADAGAIVKRLGEEPDVTIRRALLLSLGEYGEKELSPDTRQALLPKLQDIYRTASDPGLHGAAEWLLRTWHQEAWLKKVNDRWAKDQGQREKRLQGIRQPLTRDKAKAPPQWYVNGQGQTMVVIPGPVEFLMGSPPTEEGRSAEETQHQRQIGRTYALAAKPVTVEEFRRFLRAKPGLQRAFQGEVAALLKRHSPEADCPIIYANWYMAAEYCNWLSKEEGLPEEEWCYEPNPKGEYFVGMKLRPKYLSLTGYRLPTEAEWEYACRAGALTSRHYGEAEEVLGKYGWYSKNAGERSRPVGRKEPNDLGLFDLHGNVWNWCQERYRLYPEGPGVKDDIEDISSINKEDGRVLRGGSFYDHAVNVRSAIRFWYVPTYRNSNVGFRPARTVTP